MSEKIVRKTFFIHQYEKEEEFLSDMRKKGWKFQSLSVGIPTKYVFTDCEPENYLYQLDFVAEQEDTESYHQLFGDAGWEEVFQWQGMGGKWYYFCKKDASSSERIYTDINSKAELFRKLSNRYLIYFLCTLLLALNGLRIGVDFVQRGEIFLTVLGGIMSAILCAAVIILLYLCLALLKKRMEIRHRKKDVL